MCTSELTLKRQFPSSAVLEVAVEPSQCTKLRKLAIEVEDMEEMDEFVEVELPPADDWDVEDAYENSDEEYEVPIKHGFSTFSRSVKKLKEQMQIYTFAVDAEGSNFNKFNYCVSHVLEGKIREMLRGVDECLDHEEIVAMYRVNYPFSEDEEFIADVFEDYQQGVYNDELAIYFLLLEVIHGKLIVVHIESEAVEIVDLSFMDEEPPYPRARA